jgi:hypothetical protein
MAIMAWGGLYALELGKNPSRCFHDIFVVFLRPNHETSSSKTAFVVTDASVMSANDTGPEREKYLALIADKNNYLKSVGFMGAFLVFFILENTDGTKIRISFPIAFSGRNISQLNTSVPVMPWLVQLKATINDGTNFHVSPVSHTGCSHCNQCPFNGLYFQVVQSISN